MRATHSRALFAVTLAAIAGLAGACDTLTGISDGAPPASALQWKVEDHALTSGDLHAIWGASANNVFAVGGIDGIQSNVMAHYDGTSWQPMAVPSTADRRYLTGIWGSSATDVFAVGSAGMIFHYDGSSWAQMASGTGENFSAVGGTSPTNVFAAVSAGYPNPPLPKMLHYDGVAWTPMTMASLDTITSTAAHTFNAIWGSGPNDVYAVGNYKTIEHYDGTKWSVVTSDYPLGGAYSSVWGTSAHDVFVGGPGGPLLHYDGTSWAQVDLSQMPAAGAGTAVQSIWGTGPNDVYATSGQQILHYDGTSWTQATTAGAYSVSAIWAGGSVAMAVGDSGLIVAHEAGASSWTISSPPAYTLNDFWQRSTTDIYLATFDVAMMHGDGHGTWKVVLPDSVGAFRPPNSHLWGTSPTDVYGVWANSYFVSGSGLYYFGGLSHFDGTSWTPVISPSVPVFDLRGVTPTTAFAPAGGALYHFNGAAWQPLATGLTYTTGTYTTTENLRDIWQISPTSAYVVGENGVILHYNGKSLSPMSSGTTNNLYAVWGTSDEDVYAVGSNIILHYNGTKWTQADNFNDTYVGVSGGGPHDVYVVGVANVRYFNGNSWSTVKMPITERWTGVRVASPGNVYIIGFNRTVIHGTR